MTHFWNAVTIAHCMIMEFGEIISFFLIFKTNRYSPNSRFLNENCFNVYLTFWNSMSTFGRFGNVKLIEFIFLSSPILDTLPPFTLFDALDAWNSVLLLDDSVMSSSMKSTIEFSGVVELDWQHPTIDDDVDGFSSRTFDDNILALLSQSHSQFNYSKIIIIFFTIACLVLYFRTQSIHFYSVRWRLSKLKIDRKKKAQAFDAR